MKVYDLLEDFGSYKSMLKTGFQELGVKADPDPDMVKDFKKELDNILPPNQAEKASEEQIMKAQTSAARKIMKQYGLWRD